MAVAASAAAPSGVLDELDMAQVVKWGVIAALASAFVAIIGMIESFSDRMIIDPVLDLGWLAAGWLPFVFGYRATHRPTQEGLPPPSKGVHNVVGGAIAGLLSGAGLVFVIVLVETVEVRDIFPNVSTVLLDLLTFENGTGFGIIAMLAGGAALGSLGGALQLGSEKLRKAFVAAAVWLVIVSLLELVVVDVLEELPGTVEDWVYADGGGLSWGAAIVLFAAVAAIVMSVGERRRNLRSVLEALPQQQRTGLGLVLAFGLIAAGFALPSILNSFVNEILTIVGLFLLMGLGLNIVVGLAGLLDLGYVAFFAVGAYTTAVLTSPGSPKFAPTLPFIVVIPAVIVAAVLAGIAVGTPVIRMRGDYLAIVTLGFGEIARILFISDWLKPTFGGAQGILQITSIRIWRWAITVGVLAAAAGVVWLSARLLRRARPDPDDQWRPGYASPSAGIGAGVAIAAIAVPVVTGIAAIAVATRVGMSGTFVVQGSQPQLVFYAVFLFAIAAAFVSWRLQESRIGRAWMAMREDEQVAEAMGINTVTAKLLAFVMGAVLASFAGALFAAKIGSIFPNSFALIVSIIVLVLIIVGGMGNIPGVAVGAIVLLGVLGGPSSPGLLREFEEFKLLIYGTLLIYMMLKRPEGLLPSVRRTRELHQEEFMQDAWLKSQAEGASPAEGSET